MKSDHRLTAIRPDVWVTMGIGKESAGVIATAKQQARPSILSHLADGSNRVNFSEGLHFHESQSQLKVKAKSVQRSPHSQLRKMVLPVIQKNETEFKKLLPPH